MYKGHNTNNKYRNIFNLLSDSKVRKKLPAGQFSNTCFAMSVAESFGEKVKSCVFPLTKIRRRCTYNNNNKKGLNLSPQKHQPSIKVLFSSCDGIPPLPLTSFDTR